MKILIDARLYGLENAGIGRYVNNLIDSLISLKTTDNFIVLLNNKYYEELELPSNWKKIKTNFRHYSFSEQIILPFLIAKEKPDLVHFPHFNIPILYFGKFVVTIHDLLMHKQKGLDATTLNPLMYLIRRMGYRFVFDSAVKRSEKIFVPSNVVKKDIEEFYGINSNKILVTYEGVDKKMEQYSKGTNKLLKGVKQFVGKDPYLYYVGNAYPHKNLKRAIDAIVKLNESNSIKFIITTPRNVFFERVSEYIKEKKASRYVMVTNQVSDDELFALMNNSLAFIYPSLSEGFGLPGLEAMNASTLLLASDIPIFKEIYKDTALFFNPNSLEDIQNAINKAIKMDSNERKRIISKYSSVLNKYSWEKMARETYNTYQIFNSYGQQKSSNNIRSNK